MISRSALSRWFVYAIAVPSALGLNAPAADPKSCSPALEKAAAALANSEFDGAARRFGEAANDASAPAFVRGLGMCGLAETALARKDREAVLRAWRQMAEDTTLPQAQRDLANRRLSETERGFKGLPERDPAIYRVSLPSLPEPGARYHVGSKGNDSWEGTEARPFATLRRARDATRDLRKSNGGALPKGGVKILVHGGTLRVTETLELSAEDSGTADAPVVFQAVTGSAPVFTGGFTVKGWQHISDATVAAKLSPGVREKVLQADLKANGIVDWGDATSLKQRPELFVNGAPQTLARWPNQGFVKTGEILGQDTFKVWGSIAGCRDGKFKFAEDRPKTWVEEPDVRLYGYWFWDWYEEYQKVASIDLSQGSFTLDKPYSNYGYRKGQRYFAVNLLRELDESGEWYLDRRTGMLYWLPQENLEPAKADIVLSVYSAPFITLESVKHVVLLGLTFQEGRGDAVHIKYGSDCLVAGCIFRRFGGDAVVVQGGVHHGIFGCAMQTLGCGGMRVDGGDRKTLSPGNHFVENCTVSDISRIKRTYAPAVHLDGCGNRIAHNLFERIPSSAMRIEGNDHLIELNQVRNVVQESDDQGGIDMFGNPLYRGVVIRWNRWSDIVGGTECGAAGIRLDDMISGITLYGNVFERCGAVQFGAVQIHGGKDNLVDGNVFIDCFAGFSFSRWDEPRWLKSIEPFLEQATREPYANRYPELARLKKEANVNCISRNLLLGCKNVFLRDGGVEKSVLNRTEEKVVPPESLWGEGVKTTAASILLEPIPLKDIGPYPHLWRATAAGLAAP